MAQPPSSGGRGVSRPKKVVKKTRNARAINNYAFRLPDIFPLSDPHRARLLAPEPPSTERLLAFRELPILWMVGLAIPCAYGLQHGHGFSDRAEDCPWPGRPEPQKVVSPFVVLELRNSRRLQILQFLRGFLC